MSTKLPRLYQEEALDQAKDRNIIVRMDTGGGKTMIAVMLIQDIASRLALFPSQPSKLVVFLVPTVQLAFQHAKTVKEETALRTKSFVGLMGVDFWKSEEWMEQLKDVDVVICTAQVWLNVLNCAYWTMERTSLIIFDEAHHASKNHPYALIMRTHYHTMKMGASTAALLPKILGLTASPIFNPGNALKLIDNLERVLDARIYEIVKHASEIALHSTKPQERLVEFDPPTEHDTPTVFEILLDRRTDITLDPKTRARLAHTKLSLGTYAINAMIGDIVRDAAFEPSFSPNLSLQSLSKQLDANLSDQIPSSVNLSPQVCVLIDILLQYRLGEKSTDFRAIIFCERRQSAQLLSGIIERTAALSGWAKPDFLIGHGGRGNGDDDVKTPGMVVKAQEKIVAGFRSGEINLLFATTVAEEGLDFRSCNCVIRFDSLTTLKGYIQSKGRARHIDSDFIVLCERGSPSNWTEYVQDEPSLKVLYSNRPIDDEIEEVSEDDLETFRNPITDAILTHSSAVPLLAEFCALLPRDEYSPNCAPIYDTSGSGTASPSFTTQLRLPMITSLPTRTFVSGSFATKKASKQNAAFLACVALHESGAINHYMLPRRETTGEGAKDADGNVLDRSPTEAFLPTAFDHIYGDFRLDTSKVMMNVLRIDDEEAEAGSTTTHVGLIAGEGLSELDQIDLSLFDDRPDRSFTVRFVACVELAWEGDDRRKNLSKLIDFNERCFVAAVNRKADRSKFYSLWTPLLSTSTATSTSTSTSTLNDISHQIDWHQITASFSDLVDSDLSQLSHASIISTGSKRSHTGSRIFRFDQILEGVNSMSAIADIEQAATIAATSDVESMDQQQNKSQAKVKYVNPRTLNVTAEPVLVLETVETQVLNHLRSYSAYNGRPIFQSKLWAIPVSVCQLCTLSSSFLTFIRRAPSVLRSIHDTMVAKRFVAHFNIPSSIPFSAIIEALTPPVSSAGYSYQTLETVGDALLQLLTSVHIFLTFPMADEGRLTCLRMNSVDNRFLMKKALEIGLNRFVLPEIFRTSSWVPPESDAASVSVDGRTITRNVGRKSLSDSMEALLGASFLHGGIDCALTTAKRLQLCCGGDVPWCDRAGARSVGMAVASNPRLAMDLDRLEADLRYTFDDASLLLVACTHRSYIGDSATCYERMEYLGDALIEYWVTTHLIDRFPTATPSVLSFLRASLVSNGTLSFLSIRKLTSHKYIRHSSSDLSHAIQRAVAEADGYDFGKAANDLTWDWDPPKVLGDVFESIIGSVFIDSKYRLEPVIAVLDRLFAQTVSSINVDGPLRDPHSFLVMLAQGMNCTNFKIIPQPTSDPPVNVTAACSFHNEILATATRSTLFLARQRVSQNILLLYGPDSGSTFLKDRCNCAALKLVQMQSEMSPQCEP